MTDHTDMEALGRTIADLVRPYAVGDVLEQLALDCAAQVGAAAAAILVRDHLGRLTMLSSTSADASWLEMLQSQEDHGPCVDAIVANDVVTCEGADHIAERWGSVGSAIVGAGFTAVEAYPMRWHDTAIGGMNLFFSEPQPTDGSARRRVAQAFADVATVGLVHTDEVSAADVADRIREASEARSRVEQAKGALAHLEDLDLRAAHDRLHELAASSGRTVNETARAILADLAGRRRRDA